jgi:hypothetical protein
VNEPQTGDVLAPHAHLGANVEHFTNIKREILCPARTDKFSRWDSRGWVGYKEFQGVRTTRVVVSGRTCLSGTLRVGGIARRPMASEGA